MRRQVREFCKSEKRLPFQWYCPFLSDQIFAIHATTLTYGEPHQIHSKPIFTRSINRHHEKNTSTKKVARARAILRIELSVLNDFHFGVSFQFLLTSEIGNICQALMQFVTFIPVSSTSATNTSAGVAAIVDGPLTWACTGCALGHPYSDKTPGRNGRRKSDCAFG